MRPRPAPCFDLRPAIAEGSGLPSPEAPFGGADGALVLREAMQPGRRVGGVCGRSRFVGNSMKSSDFSSAYLDHLTRIGSARRQQCAGPSLSKSVRLRAFQPPALRVNRHWLAREPARTKATPRRRRKTTPAVALRHQPGEGRGGGRGLPGKGTRLVARRFRAALAF